MTTATIARPSTKANTGSRGAQAAPAAPCRPAHLGEYQHDAVPALRKRQAALQRARRAVEQTAQQIAAAESMVADVQARRAAALVGAFASGKSELPDTVRRALDDEERQLFQLSRDFAVEPETLQAVRAHVDTESAALDDEWQKLRKIGRELGCEQLADYANRCLEALNDPQLPVFQASDQLERLRDYCAAHEVFRNPDERRSVLGVEFAKMPDGTGGERMVMGRAGRLADTLGLERLFAKWAPVVGEVETDPDSNRVSTIVAELRDMFFVQPYTEAECQAEWTMYESPASRGMMRLFREEPHRLDPWTQARMAERVAQIDAAAATLRDIQRTPF